MAEALLTQLCLVQVLGAARLQRLVRAGWLTPVQRRPSRVVYRVSDVHMALRRLERETLPPDSIESQRVRRSEALNGRAYVKKVKAPPPGLDALELDFSAFNL